MPGCYCVYDWKNKRQNCHYLVYHFIIMLSQNKPNVAKILLIFAKVKDNKVFQFDFFNLMKKIKFHHLQQSNRLIIQSIRLDLKNDQSTFKKIRRFITMPDQQTKQIFKSKKKKQQLSSIRIFEPRNQNYSLPLKLNRWQTIEQQELKRIKLNIEENKQNKSLDLQLQQPQNNKKVAKIGPIIFVKEIFPDVSNKNSKQKKKITNILKFKSFKGINPRKIISPKQCKVNNLAVNPVKISIDLPKLKSKDTDILRYINKSEFLSPLKQAQRSLLLKKTDTRKVKNIKSNELSPWSTKGKICNISELVHDNLN